MPAARITGLTRFHRLVDLGQERAAAEAGVPAIAQWDRIYLTEEAARRLLNWLPNALAFAEGGAT